MLAITQIFNAIILTHKLSERNLLNDSENRIKIRRIDVNEETDREKTEITSSYAESISTHNTI